MILESRVNPQPDDPHLRIAHELHREMIRRKFSKRQRDIIDFVLTLSWGCGKPSAIIPKLKCFELCGIGKNHIRKELEDMVQSRVLFWDQSMNAFQINKHYDEWNVEIVSGFDKNELNELIHLNLETPSPNLAKKVPKKGTELPKREPEKVPETGTEFLKRELESSQKGNKKVPKKGTAMFKKPSRIKRLRLSKESIKASIKKRSSSNRVTVVLNVADKKPPPATPDFSYGGQYKIFSTYFNSDQKKIEFETEIFTELYDRYGGEWMYHAFREAGKHGKYNLPYVEAILHGYSIRGGPQKDKQNAVSAAGAAAATEWIDINDPITRRMLEESERQDGLSRIS